MEGNMPTETTTKPRRERLPLNGVDTPTLFGTLDVVKGQPELAKFQFRARNRWQSGTLSETTIGTFSGAGGEHAHKTTFTVSADHPGVLVGEDRAPLPVEFLLHALASCITGGIANIAAARGVKLREVESTIEGDINLLGIFGMSKDVRNGYEGIRASFSIKGDAPPEKLQEIVEQSRARSAVFDVLTNGMPVSMSVNAG
jgi:uncharacterized OsmC-like protein